MRSCKSSKIEDSVFVFEKEPGAYNEKDQESPSPVWSYEDNDGGDITPTKG